MDTAKKKKMFIVWGSIFCVALLAIISYRIYVNQHDNKQRAARATEVKGVAVEVGTVTRKEITPKMVFSANLEPLWSADISPKVDGRIAALSVDEGDSVAAGMVVATLDTDELMAQVIQAQGSLQASQANLEQAELSYQRNKSLAEQGAVSQQVLDSARTTRDLNIGQVRSAQGNLELLNARLGNANVVAPRAGVVLKRYLQSGYYAKAGSQIISIGDVSKLLAKAIVGEAQVAQLAVGTQVKVKVGALQGKEFVGVITRISPAAVMPSRTFTAEITISATEGILKPGMFVNAEVPSSVRQNALVVPEGALVSREDQKTVYVVGSDNKVMQKVLKLGYVGDGMAEVLEGLSDGDRIVLSGQNKLKDGSMISVPEEGGK
ncbi:MAG: efflux RND transporter periplasmic adaptor subunit [Pelosinus sp.]|nr:efflux RND transporter periplasmic adaptor subunit [Pelosinus sp.]